MCYDLDWESFSWYNHALFAAGVPNLGFAATLGFAAHCVVSAKANQFRGVANLLATELRGEVREIDIARMLVRLIDADVATRFTRSVVVGD